jgi:hypothetical protein
LSNYISLVGLMLNYFSSTANDGPRYSKNIPSSSSVAVI